MRSILVSVMAVALLASGVREAHAKTLSIDPVAQQTAAWCWAAVAQMVFKHHDMRGAGGAGVQCEVVKFGYGPVCGWDCRACSQSTALTMENLAWVLESFPVAAGERGLESTVGFALTRSEIVRQIDAGRPIVAGISPSGRIGWSAEHVALIIGYEGDVYDFAITVNDPFPYAETRSRDPYLAAGGRKLRAGQYRIRLSEFTRRLSWTHSISDISDRRVELVENDPPERESRAASTSYRSFPDVGSVVAALIEAAPDRTTLAKFPEVEIGPEDARRRIDEHGFCSPAKSAPLEEWVGRQGTTVSTTCYSRKFSSESAMEAWFDDMSERIRAEVEPKGWKPRRNTGEEPWVARKKHDPTRFSWGTNHETDASALYASLEGRKSYGANEYIVEVHVWGDYGPRLAPTPTATPITATQPPAETIEARLLKLKALRDQNLITAEEYTTKRAAILGEL